MKELMTIHEVATILGISTDAIRLYEKEGLITPFRDSDNGYRLYNLKHVHTLLGISLYRQLDVSISEIKELFTIDNFDGILDHITNLISKDEAEIKKLQNKIDRMYIVKDHLRALETGLSTYSIKQLEKRYVMSKNKPGCPPTEYMLSVFNSPYFSSGHLASIVDYSKVGTPDARSYEFTIRESAMNLLPAKLKNEVIEQRESCTCLYTVLKSRGSDCYELDYSSIYEYARQNNLNISNFIQCFYVYSLSSDGVADNYYEAYVEIIK